MMHRCVHKFECILLLLVSPSFFFSFKCRQRCLVSHYSSCCHQNPSSSLVSLSRPWKSSLAPHSVSFIFLNLLSACMALSFLFKIGVRIKAHFMICIIIHHAMLLVSACINFEEVWIDWIDMIDGRS